MWCHLRASFRRSLLCQLSLPSSRQRLRMRRTHFVGFVCFRISALCVISCVGLYIFMYSTTNIAQLARRGIAAKTVRNCRDRQRARTSFGLVRFGSLRFYGISCVDKTPARTHKRRRTYRQRARSRTAALQSTTDAMDHVSIVGGNGTPVP